MKGRKQDQSSKVILENEDAPRPSNASSRKSSRKSKKPHSKRKNPISRNVKKSSRQSSIRQGEKHKPCPEAPSEKAASDADKGFTKFPALPGQGKSVYVCHTCGKTFDKKSSAVEHMKGHTDVKPFSCEVCRKQFARKGDVKKHFLIHVDEKRYLCDRCGMQFKKSGSIHRHMRSHAGEKMHVCDICGRAYSRPEDLKLHVGGHHEKTIKCELCEKMLGSTMALKKHLKIHTRNKQQKQPLDKIHLCTQCGRSFSLKSTLRNHLKTHDQRRDHVNSCDICGTKFYHKDSLKRHMHIHSETKPFCCEICGRGFNQHIRYRVHMEKYHPDEELPNQTKKSLACELCSKVFTKASYLADHVCYQNSDALSTNPHLLGKFENITLLGDADTSHPHLDHTTNKDMNDDDSEDTVDYDADCVKTFDDINLEACSLLELAKSEVDRALGMPAGSPKIIADEKGMCDTKQNSLGDETEMETKLGTIENSEMKSSFIVKKGSNGTNVDVNLSTVNNDTDAGIAVETANNDTNAHANANVSMNSYTKSDVSVKTVNKGTGFDAGVENLNDADGEVSMRIAGNEKDTDARDVSVKPENYVTDTPIETGTVNNTGIDTGGDVKPKLDAGACKSLDEIPKNKSVVISDVRDKIETEANIHVCDCEAERNVTCFKAREPVTESRGYVGKRTKAGLRKDKAHQEVNESVDVNHKSTKKYNTRTSKAKMGLCMSETKDAKELSGASEGYIVPKRRGARNKTGKCEKTKNVEETLNKRPTKKRGRQPRKRRMPTNLPTSQNSLRKYLRKKSDIPDPCISVNILNTNDTIVDESVEMSCDEIVTDKDSVYGEECTDSGNVVMDVKCKAEHVLLPVWPVEMFSRGTIKTEPEVHVDDNVMNPGTTLFSAFRTIKQEPLEEGEIRISETNQFDIRTIKKEH